MPMYICSNCKKKVLQIRTPQPHAEEMWASLGYYNMCFAT